MPASVNIAPAWNMDGPTWNGANLRPIFSGLLAPGNIQVMSGVLPGGGAWFVVPGGGMSVTVGTGYGVIASSSGVTAGGYLCAATSTTTLTVAGADPTNPRIDLVCATVSDVGSSASTWLLQVVTGTAAPSPSAPATPANSLALAQVLVPAGSSSVTSGNVTDERVFTAMHGGIIPVPNLTSGPAALTGYQGMHIYDRATQRTARLTPGGAVAQPLLLPVAPQLARQTGTVGATGGSVTVATVSVTTDGSTDLEILAKWPEVTIATSGALGIYAVVFYITIDGTQVAAQNSPAGTTSASGIGGSLHHVTSSGIDRPSNGTHTVVLGYTVIAGDGTHQLQVAGSATAPATLYVRAAPL